MTQHLTVKFHRDDKRAYTYKTDLAPVAVGDRVEIPVGKANRLMTGYVETILTDEEAEALRFDCKHIARRVDPEVPWERYRMHELRGNVRVGAMSSGDLNIEVWDGHWRDPDTAMEEIVVPREALSELASFIMWAER
jgi:hypothetical protein